MSLFSDIPVRGNGDFVNYSWFNALRTAGLSLEAFMGASYVASSIAVANAQSNAVVTGLVFSSASCKSAIVFVEIRRKSDSAEVTSVGRLVAIYRELTSTWELIDEMGGDEDGITFDITAAGQIRYTSDTVAGTNYAGTMKFRAMTF